MELQNSKSLLARLMAQENLTVNHASVSTAFFDLQNRTLTLPVWKDMTGDIYDLLCGHEVGHALETPEQGWHNAVVDAATGKVNATLKGYLNILEDARIEKKIKKRYPGLRSSFYRAYKELFDRDFFGLKKYNKEYTDLLLIDRINLHFKLGNLAAIPFTDSERPYIDRIEALETWAEVEALARELLENTEQELEEQQKKGRSKQPMTNGNESGEPGQSTEADFEEDEDAEPQQQAVFDRSAESLTDREFREREKSLVNNKPGHIEYLTLPEVDSHKFVVNYRTVLKQFVVQSADAQEIKSLVGGFRQSFKKKNDRFIGQLVKEFEMRRNAQQQARAKISKSGEIDVKRVFQYQISDDLFRRFTTLPQGKNHGLVLFYDLSGSMQEVMPSVIEQLLVLVEFCRRANIKFEVYGFSNNPASTTDVRFYENANKRWQPEVGKVWLYDQGFNLRQYFTDAMSSRDYSAMVDNLLVMREIHRAKLMRYNYEQPESVLRYATVPVAEELGGTPLNQSIMVAQDIHRRFVERTRAEVVNMVWLTDGESDAPITVTEAPSSYHKPGSYKFRYMAKPEHHTVYLRHDRLKYEIKLKAADKKGTFALIEMLRHTTNSNVVCFDIVRGAGRRYFTDMLYSWREAQEKQNQKIVEDLCQQYRRNRIAVIKDTGYSEYYVIPGDAKSLAVADDELEVKTEDKKELMNAFMDLQDKKRSSRILLNRFIDMIA